MRLAFLAIPLLLAACATPERQAAKDCYGAGLRPNTAPFERCTAAALGRVASATRGAMDMIHAIEPIR